MLRSPMNGHDRSQGLDGAVVVEILLGSQLKEHRCILHLHFVAGISHTGDIYHIAL